MTSKPMWGFPNADGISVACAETVVERNVRLSKIQHIVVGLLRSGAYDRPSSIRPMELLSSSVRRVVRSGTITSFQGPVLS